MYVVRNMASYKDEDTLRRLYIDESMSMEEIADELNCSSDTISRWANKFEIETGRLTNEERSSLSITNYQRQLIKGVLMGDGCIKRRGHPSHKPFFVVTMTNKKFIEWLSRELGDIVSSVRKRTGEYADTLENTQWILKTYSHDMFREFADWYKTGQKRWPTDEKFTKLELKMLYVTDGSPVKNTNNWAAKISAINECDRKQKISNMFEREFGISMSWHSSDANTNGNIYIHAGSADVIWNQEPVTGFDYKWPNNL